MGTTRKSSQDGWACTASPALGKELAVFCVGVDRVLPGYPNASTRFRPAVHHRTFALGVILSIVFQLAHVSKRPTSVARPGDAPDGEAGRPPDGDDGDLPATTRPVVVAGRSNLRDEHHCSRICHVRYPALSKIVRPLARSTASGTLLTPRFGPECVHYRWLRRGRSPRLTRRGHRGGTVHRPDSRMAGQPHFEARHAKFCPVRCAAALTLGLLVLVALPHPLCQTSRSNVPAEPGTTSAVPGAAPVMMQLVHRG